MSNMNGTGVVCLSDAPAGTGLERRSFYLWVVRAVLERRAS